MMVPSRCLEASVHLLRHLSCAAHAETCCSGSTHAATYVSAKNAKVTACQGGGTRTVTKGGNHAACRVDHADNGGWRGPFLPGNALEITDQGTCIPGMAIEIARMCCMPQWRQATAPLIFLMDRIVYCLTVLTVGSAGSL